MRKLSTKITENPHGGDLAVLPPCAPVAFDDVVHDHQGQLPWSVIEDYREDRLRGRSSLDATTDDGISNQFYNNYRLCLRSSERSILLTLPFNSQG